MDPVFAKQIKDKFVFFEIQIVAHLRKDLEVKNKHLNYIDLRFEEVNKKTQDKNIKDLENSCQKEIPQIAEIQIVPVLHCTTCYIAHSELPKWKTTKLEDDQSGRKPKWKTTIFEDDQNGRQQNGRRPNWKTTKMEDD